MNASDFLKCLPVTSKPLGEDDNSPIIRFAQATGPQQPPLTQDQKARREELLRTALEQIDVPAEHLQALRDLPSDLAKADEARRASQNDLDNLASHEGAAVTELEKATGQPEPADLDEALAYRATVADKTARLELIRERLAKARQNLEASTKTHKALSSQRATIIRGAAQHIAVTVMPAECGGLTDLELAAVTWAIDRAAFSPPYYAEVSFTDYLHKHFRPEPPNELVALAERLLRAKIDEAAQPALQKQDAA